MKAVEQFSSSYALHCNMTKFSDCFLCQAWKNVWEGRSGDRSVKKVVFYSALSICFAWILTCQWHVNLFCFSQMGTRYQVHAQIEKQMLTQWLDNIKYFTILLSIFINEQCWSIKWRILYWTSCLNVIEHWDWPKDDKWWRSMGRRWQYTLSL